MSDNSERTGLTHIGNLMSKVLESYGIKPIETLYDGVRFRSRLEARWAVFFNAIGIQWEYEKEGYDLNGVWYLPDFWVPQWNSWVEIKPEKPSAEENNKVTLLCKATQKPAYLFFGSFPNQPIDALDIPMAYGFSPPLGYLEPAGHLSECYLCGQVGVVFPYAFSCIKHECHCPECSLGWDGSCNLFSERIISAYRAARIERFIR